MLKVSSPTYKNSYVTIQPNISNTLAIKSALALGIVVVVLGAFTRLTDSGLGCPDWPGCFGQLIVPGELPWQDKYRAWIEMIHRYFAGTLGLLIAYLFWQQPKSWLTRTLVLLVIGQALLGMWTVTLKLYPIVVTSHLIGGLTIVSCLWLLELSKQSLYAIPGRHRGRPLHLLAMFALILVIVQIFLGGWTAANYASLACLDFPTCNGQLLPKLDLTNAFDLLNAGFAGSPGQRLSYQALMTIHVMHRYVGIITAIVVLIYATLTKNILLTGLIILQVILGITNILAALPVSVALAHYTVAVLLLLSLIYENYRYYKSTNY